MIDQTLFAISQSDAKPIHTGSLFELEDGIIQVVSVDGYRLALRREHVSSTDSLRFVVPGRTLTEVSRILDPDSEEEAECYVARKHVFFQAGQYEVYSRLLEGDFLDYQAAIPKNGSIRVRVSTREMIDSVDRVSLLINDRLKSPLRVKFEKSEILLSCSTALGRASDSFHAENEGEPIEMGFNNRYLLDALRSTDCDEVILEIAGPLSPMKVLPVDGDSFLFLVLPVRLRTEG
jgi:DNA polymerase-3 subunit beta